MTVKYSNCSQLATREESYTLKMWVERFNMSHPSESNRRPAAYEAAALPTELGWHAST